MRTKHNIIAIAVIGIALAIVIVIVGGISWGDRATAPGQTARNNQPGGAATSTASSTPPARVYTPHPPHGAVTYEIAQAATQLPAFVQATIDPTDVAVGQVQRFTIVTDDPNPVVSVEARITTDHKTITVPLASKGTPAVSMLVPRTMEVGSDGRLALIAPGKGGNDVAKQGANVANAATTNQTKFTGQWTVEDTHSAKYNTTFIAKDAAGNQNSITLDWTDPCPFSATTGYTTRDVPLSSPCTMLSDNSDGTSNVDGPENGDLNLTATLTISAGVTLVLNSGQGINISGAGAIAAIPPTAQIVFGQDMCGTDNDGDHYIVGKNWTATSTTCGSIGMTSRASLASSTIPSPFNDCNDSDGRAHPNQAAYYTTQEVGTPGPGGAWDFDCSGAAVKQLNVISTYTCGSSVACNTPAMGCAGISCNNTQSGTGGWLTSVPACGATSTYMNGTCNQYSTGQISGSCGVGCSGPTCNSGPNSAIQTQGCH